ncbi:hypothetical protein HYFRA_00013345 [Hymenoscyphus fraxineus]|uniref:Rhodopsin domain-containing protein n=1 Tax=Hymenoscyphus fraxineus TaxID=746836 RepID=A0A9N9LC06_9HELO|nr:hypothetical protein HYFRA_00013345 [Hymenoscyphus fraxineus]
MSTNEIADFLKDFPALPPPPGVKSNFDHPADDRASVLIILNAIFLSLTVIAVSMRLYAKGMILHTLGWDDYTCVISGLLSALHTAAMLDMLNLGYGRHLWDLRAVTFLKPSNVIRVSSLTLIYPVCIYFIKLSILLLYLRIFGVDRKIRNASYFCIGFLTLFYISYEGVQIATNVRCTRPLRPNSSLGVCRSIYAVNVYQSVFNVASDFYIYLIPIPAIRKLHVSRRQKFGLLAMFLVGFVPCAVSVARLIIITITLNHADKLWYASLSSTLTSIVEINVGIIASCMTALPGVFARLKTPGMELVKSLRSKFTTSFNKASKDSSRRNNTTNSTSVANEFQSEYIQLDEPVKRNVTSEQIPESLRT